MALLHEDLLQVGRRFGAAFVRLERDESGRVNVFETTWFSIYCSDSTPSTR